MKTAKVNTLRLHLIRAQYSPHRKNGPFTPKRAPHSSMKSVRIVNKLDYFMGFPDEEITRKFQAAVQKALEEQISKSLPIALYDKNKLLPYILYPDGRREYVRK